MLAAHKIGVNAIGWSFAVALAFINALAPRKLSRFQANKLPDGCLFAQCPGNHTQHIGVNRF